MKQRSSEPSSATLRVRCTPSELAAYRLLAARKGKSLADMIRESLRFGCMRECLCEQGKPPCMKCSQDSPKQVQESQESQADEPRLVRGQYDDQEGEQKQRELEAVRLAAEALPLLPADAVSVSGEDVIPF